MEKQLLVEIDSGFSTTVYPSTPSKHLSHRENQGGQAFSYRLASIEANLLDAGDCIEKFRADYVFMRERRRIIVALEIRLIA